MSELLRAVMDASCVYKNPVFYSMRVFSTANTGTQQTMTGRVQIPGDRWFLCMGVYRYEVRTDIKWIDIFGENIGPEPQIMKTRLYNPLTGFDYYANGSSVPIPAGLANDNLNQGATLPEYILLGPQEIIAADITGAGLHGGSQFFNWVVLAGIDYKR